MNIKKLFPKKQQNVDKKKYNIRVLKRLQHCVVWCHLNSKIYKYMFKKKAKTNIYVALVRY